MNVRRLPRKKKLTQRHILQDKYQRNTNLIRNHKQVAKRLCIRQPFRETNCEMFLKEVQKSQQIRETEEGGREREGGWVI